MLPNQATSHNQVFSKISEKMFKLIYQVEIFLRTKVDNRTATSEDATEEWSLIGVSNPSK